MLIQHLNSKRRKYDPKTSRSRRMIILPPFAIEMLNQHRLDQEKARLKAGARWKEQGLVFSNTHGGYLHPDYLLVKFHRLLKEIGLPDMRLHDLRHSAATILLSMGVHPK